MRICEVLIDSAAMEPRRDDGDDDPSRQSQGRIHRAAMEPRRDDGDDDPRWHDTPLGSEMPQWSPVVTTGTTDLPGICLRRADRRNGAPS